MPDPAELEILTPDMIRTLDRLLSQAVRSADYCQIWAYVQVEAGQVRQLGISPVAGVSIRLPDGGRRRRSD